jgi:hypothetical protein
VDLMNDVGAYLKAGLTKSKALQKARIMLRSVVQDSIQIYISIFLGCVPPCQRNEMMYDMNCLKNDNHIKLWLDFVMIKR